MLNQNKTQKSHRLFTFIVNYCIIFCYNEMNCCALFAFILFVLVHVNPAPMPLWWCYNYKWFHWMPSPIVKEQKLCQNVAIVLKNPKIFVLHGAIGRLTLIIKITNTRRTVNCRKCSSFYYAKNRSTLTNYCGHMRKFHLHVCKNCCVCVGHSRYSVYTFICAHVHKTWVNITNKNQ